MIRVAVIDDHAIIRKGMKHILRETGDMTVVGEADCGGDTLPMLRRARPDVVALDISLPDMDGLELVARIKAELPKVPILIVSLYSEEQYARRAFRAGASGYLVKSKTSEEVVKAIRKVSQGGRYVSAEMMELLGGDYDPSLQKPLHETLSDREFQILCFLARGRRLKDIAIELSLNSKTISTYRTRILEKMGMQNNAEIIRYALENYLIETTLRRREDEG